MPKPHPCDAPQVDPEHGRTLDAVLVSTFLTTLGIGIFSFLFPLVALDKGISASAIGFSFSGYFLAKLLPSTVAGWASERVGPRLPLLAAGLAGAAAPPLLALLPPETALPLVQLVLGLVGGVLKPVSLAVLGARSPEGGAGRVFGLYNVSLYLALVAGPLLGGHLYRISGLGLVVWPVSGCMLAALLVLLLLPRGICARRAHPRQAGDVRRRLRAVDFVALLLALAGRTAGSAALFAFLPVLLKQQGFLDTWFAGALQAVPSAVVILALPWTSKLADRRSRRRLVLLGMGLSALGLALAGLTQSLPALCLLCAAIGLGSAVSLPASMSLASDASLRQGSVMGVFQAAANAGFVIGPALGGLLLSRGGVEDVFFWSGVAGAAALAPFGLGLLRGTGDSEGAGTGGVDRGRA